MILHLEPTGAVPGIYPRIGQLCDQIEIATARREEILARFGEPIKSKGHWDTFVLGARITFLYGEGRVKKLSFAKASGR